MKLKVSQIYKDDVKMVRLRLNSGWDYVWFTYHQEKGFISITSSFGNWSYIWSSMGEGTKLSEFFSQANSGYLSNKLMGRAERKVFDLDDAVKDVKKDIIEERRNTPEFLSKEKARSLFDAIDELGEDYEGSSSEGFANAFSDSRTLMNWNPDFWETSWGFRDSPSFCTLHDEIIPMIQSYFKGELRAEEAKVPTQEA